MSSTGELAALGERLPLVVLGHRRIMHVAGGSGEIRTDRRNGYLRAMRRNGLDRHVAIIEGDLTESAGKAAAETLIAAGELPTAVVAGNDRIVIGLLDALRRSGIDVPGQVSVIGYDDSPLAQLSHVDLTSVSQDPLEQAKCAVTAVVERLDGQRTEATAPVLQPRLIVHETTGPPRETGS